MKSMTGYGAKSFFLNGYRVQLEIKSYNHKYLDIMVRLPRPFSALENIVKKEVASCCERGKIEVYLTLTEMPIEEYFDESRAIEVYRFLKRLNGKIESPEEVTIRELVVFKDLFIRSKEEFKIDKKLETEFLKYLRICLKQFVKSREIEGASLKKDILKRLKAITNYLKKVEKIIPAVKERHKERIKKRVEEFLSKDIQNERLEQELFYFLDKIDVNEEITRLKQHIKNFEKILSENGSCGKKLDFYAQEMMREINTLSVKSSDGEVSEIAIEMKVEVEKIREQVQNVE